MLHRLLVKQTEHTMQLLDIDWVRQHLRKSGVAPYLPAIADRVEQDVAYLQKRLEMSEDQALQFLRGEVVSQDKVEPDGREQAGHPQ